MTFNSADGVGMSTLIDVWACVLGTYMIVTAEAQVVGHCALEVQVVVVWMVHFPAAGHCASAVQVPPADPTLWDPVPVTLPTYVTKPAAGRRTVRTIDLDDTGVWTSGRTDADAAIARDAHAADRAERTRRAEGPDHRAVGS